MTMEQALAQCNGNFMTYGGCEAWRGEVEEDTEPCPGCGEKDEHNSRGQIICNGCDAVKNKRED